jgi:glycosyltransferase involved in cell wall biosynthesis
MRIAMLLHKSVEHDSRVRREASALAEDGHDVTVLHLPREPGELEGPLDGFRVHSVTPPAWVRRRLPFALYRLVFFAAFVGAVRRLRPDVVHAHDAAMLAPGYAAARLAGARLVYDSHEYAAGVPYRERAWALLVTALERTLIRRCAAVLTVSDGIADRLRERYSLRTRPTVVRNTADADASARSPATADLRELLGIDGTLVLHQGAIARDRGGRALVEALALLPGCDAVLLGAGDGPAVDELFAVARARGVADRVHVLPAVPVATLLSHTTQADVGLSLLEDTCENHRLALPNKVFEYLAAGVPVVLSDLPESRRTFGDVSGVRLVDVADPRAVAAAIRRAAEIGKVDADGLTDHFGWPTDAARLRALYEALDRNRT